MPEFTPGMLVDPAAKKAPTFSPISPKNSPELPTLPSGELGSYLSLVTPEGAAALHFALWGVRFGVELYPLPLTKPRAPCPDWLRWELEHRLTSKRVPLKHEDIAHLVELLASGPSRPDMFPAYRPHAWRFDRHRTETGRRGTWARRVAAAVASDLGDYNLIEVSAKVLGLHDHELPGDGKPEKAREFRRYGRKLLHLLGVWPWAHVDSGKLLKSWRTDPTFLEPLQVWHERACGEREHELIHCRSAFVEGHLWRRDEDLLKLPHEGDKSRRPAGSRHFDDRGRFVGQGPRRHLTKAEARKQEDGIRALNALAEEEDKRLKAREQARKARRPMR